MSLLPLLDNELLRPIPELSTTCNTREGPIHAVCFARGKQAPYRYEIHVCGFGWYAIVDEVRPRRLQTRIRQAIEAFATAARLRTRGLPRP